MRLIDLETMVVVANDEGSLHMTWGTFLKINEDALEEINVPAILKLWQKWPDATYHGGGGAFGAWTIRQAATFHVKH